MLPSTSVAARVRLSKSSDTYRENRAAHPEPQYEALLNAGRTFWHSGERVRFYRRQDKAYCWLRDDEDNDVVDADDARDYDVDYYLNVLLNSYAGRLRKAFAPPDWEQLFRLDTQLGLFDRPIDDIQPIRIRCEVIPNGDERLTWSS
jgi:hypothetical protein